MEGNKPTPAEVAGSTRRADHSNSLSSCSDNGVNRQRCQVQGCNDDLKNARRYHRRHRVCETHFKASAVCGSSGFEERFCQQCSRFHVLSEFDEGKRSCRAKLAGHNERRRKPPPVMLPPSEEKIVLTDRLPSPAQKVPRIFQSLEGCNCSLKSSEMNCCSSEAAERVLSLLSNSVEEGNRESQAFLTTRGTSPPDAPSPMQLQSQLSTPLNCCGCSTLFQ